MTTHTVLLSSLHPSHEAALDAALVFEHLTGETTETQHDHWFGWCVFTTPEGLAASLEQTDTECTCDDCSARTTCELAYDPYNTEGDCLAAHIGDT